MKSVIVTWALVLIACVLLVRQVDVARRAERTAYARGYAAAVDSVRSADTLRAIARNRSMHDDMPDAEPFYFRGDSVTVWYKGHAYVCVQGRELRRVREIHGVAR